MARRRVPMPTSIKVGPYTYDVRCDEAAINALRAEHQDERVGNCDEHKLCIIVDPNLAAGQQRSTVLHESLHAIATLVDLDATLRTAKRDHEEAMCANLEAVLLSLLRDNPDLVAYLVADE